MEVLSVSQCCKICLFTSHLRETISEQFPPHWAPCTKPGVKGHRGASVWFSSLLFVRGVQFIVKAEGERCDEASLDTHFGFIWRKEGVASFHLPNISQIMRKLRRFKCKSKLATWQPTARTQRNQVKVELQINKEEVWWVAVTLCWVTPAVPTAESWVGAVSGDWGGKDFLFP